MSKIIRISCITALIAGVVLFNSCCSAWLFGTSDVEKVQNIKASDSNSAYGSYLAGRVAHLRQDFNTASDYYINVIKKDPKNKELIGRVYIMLATKGRVKEAAQYSQMAIENGDKNNFTYIIIAINDMKEGRFDETNKTLNKLQGNVYKDFINPLISAWAYAGEGNREKALETISLVNKEPSFRAIYHFHAGMLNDYFGNNEEAERFYGYIVKNAKTEMSFRALQVISNFYLRIGQKEKAIEMVNQYSDDRLFANMLDNLRKNINNTDPQKAQKLINNPNVGVSEALFSIAATLRQGAAGIDLAHVFICLSIYSNPDYDLSKLLLADILESRGLYSDANEVYDEIDSSSEAYLTAQLKKATNLALMKDYKGAELLLKSLALDNDKNPQIYLDLGDALRLQGDFPEAIKYYKKAIDSVSSIEDNHWVLLYALGAAYERNDQWEEAETQFRTAVEMSQNHYLVLNYLGYSLMKQNKDTEAAFGMIVDAYNQAPQDGNIIDSLGWALYKLGKYDQAIKYLEKASELEPASAVIYDHLGDALWQGGYKNQAKFQWKHSLSMKDDSGELIVEDVKEKLKEGMPETKPLNYDPKIVDEKIKEISAD